MELEFRQANAEDAAACVDLVYSASPELFEHLFTTGKKSAKEYLAHEFRHGGGFFGHRIHTVAVLHGEVVGVAAFYGRKAFKAMQKEALVNLFRFYGLLGMIPLAFRAWRTSSLVKMPRRGAVYIANVGVRPDMRGQGIGSALIRHGTARAKAEGFTEMSLDVASDNPKAEALYRRLGFSFVREKRIKGRANAGLPKARFFVMPIPK
jgi:ribosomal protein S18 acetylase RimI-like enzyme